MPYQLEDIEEIVSTLEQNVERMHTFINLLLRERQQLETLVVKLEEKNAQLLAELQNEDLRVKNSSQPKYSFSDISTREAAISRIDEHLKGIDRTLKLLGD